MSLLSLDLRLAGCLGLGISTSVPIGAWSAGLGIGAGLPVTGTGTGTKPSFPDGTGTLTILVPISFPGLPGCDGLIRDVLASHPAPGVGFGTPVIVLIVEFSSRDGEGCA